MGSGRDRLIPKEPPFRKAQCCYVWGARLRNVRVEDQTEPFPSYFQEPTFGKICSALGSETTEPEAVDFFLKYCFSISALLCNISNKRHSVAELQNDA
jgi:hypothetical protein